MYFCSGGCCCLFSPPLSSPIHYYEHLSPIYITYNLTRTRKTILFTSSWWWLSWWRLFLLWCSCILIQGWQGNMTERRPREHVWMIFVLLSVPYVHLSDQHFLGKEYLQVVLKLYYNSVVSLTTCEIIFRQKNNQRGSISFRYF